MKRSIRLGATVSAAAFALAWWTAPPALASCVTNGTTTTCSGNSGGGAVGFSQAGSGNTVINLGTLTGTTTGVAMTGSNNTVTNFGTIAGDTAVSMSAGILNVVTNNGTITGTSFGIRYGGDFGTVTNNGSITANVGISMPGDGHTVINNGTIVGTTDGINVTGDTETITNNGSITAAQGAGIALTGAGTIVNNGTITNIATNASGALIGTAVNATATFTNNGTVNGVMTVVGDVTNGGLITITAAGVGATHSAVNFTQTASGVLQLRVDAAGNRDRLTAEGNATLGGTLRLNLQPGLYGNTTLYTSVIGASALNGTRFAAIPTPSPFFSVSATYVDPFPASVSITLTRIPFNLLPGLTQNQQAIATALEGQYSTGLTGDPATLYANLLLAPSTAVFDSLSGEIATAVQNPSFALGTQVLDTMFGQLDRRGDNPCSARGSGGGGSAGSPRWAAYVAGTGLGGHRDGDAGVGSARLNSSSGGGAVGADGCVAPNLVVGFVLGGATTDFSLDGRTANGSASSGFAGTYGSMTFGPLYINLGLAYLRNQYSTTRNVSVNTLNEIATGSFAGNQFASRIEAGWHFHFGTYELTPFIGLSGQVLRQNGFSESATNTATGQPGILGLNMNGTTTNAPLPVIGGMAEATYNLSEMVTVTPRLRLSWGHETSTDRSASGSFQSLPGASFSVNGARAARNALNLRAGVDVDILQFVELYAQFDGALASGGNGLAGSAGVRMTW